MLFVSNHDKNAWEGTEYEQFGDALVPAVVLSVVSEGMPLIYNGQEAGSDRRLVFFDKDEIEWREDEQGELYRRLLALRRAAPRTAQRRCGRPHGAGAQLRRGRGAELRAGRRAATGSSPPSTSAARSRR